MKPLSYDDAWSDLTAMVRGNASLLAVMAGVFLLLPNFAQSIWAPAPEIKSFDLNALKALNDYFMDNFLVLLLCQLPVWFGTAAILALLLDSRRLTVADALKAAGALLIGVILLNWLTQLAIFGGMFIFLLPGLYLLGRLAAAAPAQMAERIANPLNAISRSFALTRGNGWRTTGLVILVAIVAAVAGSALGSVIGALVRFGLPETVADPVDALLRAAIGAATALLMTLLSAAIYRQLNSTQRVAAGS